jgi:protocatechuate 3,4-dioxygenase beta subunit
MNHDRDENTRIGRMLSRRKVLALFGTSAGAGALTATMGGSLWRRLGWGSPFQAAPAAAAEPCIVRPEQTEGPYFVDERLNRSDIRSDPGTAAVKEGVQLALTFVVQRSQGGSCVPLAGALVDVWQCDALGVYSDVSDPSFNTVGQRFLRGYQVTDVNGAASFTTIYPGWYQGRTVHMHFKVRTDPESATGFEFTSQLYFDDALTDVVHAQQPYAAKGPRTLRNDADGIYRNGGDQLRLTPGDDGAGGYAATFAITLEISQTDASLALALDRALYRTGDEMLATATLAPGAAGGSVDAYLVVQTPAGSLFSLQPNGLVPGVTPVATGFVPLAFSGVVLRHRFTGGEPPGLYTWFAALTQAGTTTLVGSASQVSFTFSP